MLVFDGFLLLGGRLADLIGRSRMVLCGLVLFSVTSLACRIATQPSHRWACEPCPPAGCPATVGTAVFGAIAGTGGLCLAVFVVMRGQLQGWTSPVTVVEMCLATFDRLGRYLYHCHFLAHSRIGVMAQLEVVP